MKGSTNNTRAIALALVTLAAIAAALVIAYTSGEPNYRTLLQIAIGFGMATIGIAVVLAKIRFRAHAAAVLLIALVGEIAAVRAVVQFRRDFDSVMPRPLAEKAGVAPGAGPTAPIPATPVVTTPVEAPPPAVEAVTPTAAAAATRIDLSATTALDSPQFLGPERNGAVDRVKLARDWSAKPPQRIWRQPIGAGWGSFALVNGYAITLEQDGQEERVVCYEIATGKRVWSYAIKARYENDAWPEAGIGPRSTPAVKDGRVYSLGATGRLLCLDGSTGELLWEHDLLKEYGVTPEQEKVSVPYGRSNSPLIVDDLVIVAAGGPPGRRVSLVAFDRTSGEKRWDGGNRQISQSSPALMTLAGRRQIVSVNEDSVTGHDIATGNVLWEQSWPGATTGPVNVAQAQFVPPNRFFVSKSYGGGAALYEIASVDGGLVSREIWKSNRVMRTRFTNVTIRGDYVYGLSDGILECIELATGERVWKDGRYGHGQLLRADDLLVILAESGEVAMVEASPDSGGKELGRFQAIEGTSWNPPTLYGDLLVIRNAKEAAVYKLALAANAAESSSER